MIPYGVFDFWIIKSTWFLLYGGVFVIFVSSSHESMETKQRLRPFSANIHLVDSVVFRKPNRTKSWMLVLFLWLMTHVTKQLYFKFYVDIFGKLMSIKMQKELRTLLNNGWTTKFCECQWCHMTSSLGKIVHISVKNLKSMYCLLVFRKF